MAAIAPPRPRQSREEQNFGPKRRASPTQTPAHENLGVNVVWVRVARSSRERQKLRVGPLPPREATIDARDVGVFLGFGQRSVKRPPAPSDLGLGDCP